MPPKKKVQETKGEITVPLSLVPAFAFVSDRPELHGYTFVGRTPDAALINAKAALTHYYKVRGYWPINITIKEDDDSTA